MREIELKFLDVDVKAVVKALRQLGARKEFSGDMHFIHFDTPSRDLRKKNSFIRLRSKGNKSELTFKKLIFGNMKVAEETEVVVSDFRKMRKMLLMMGFTEIKHQRKHRDSYALPDAHFELDTYAGIPTFLEIEAQTQKTLKHYVSKLGFSMKDAKPWSGRQVLDYYKGRK